MTGFHSLIGLTGKMGSGKDTVFQRILELYPDYGFIRHGFADMLKESVCALLNISRMELEQLKNDSLGRVEVHGHPSSGMARGTVRVSGQSVRSFLQRYGTEAHRNIFGKNFWVYAAMARLEQEAEESAEEQSMYNPVFTDVRFDNEAEEIISRGGIVVEVIGPVGDTGSHTSELGVSEHHIHSRLVNIIRDDGYENIDRQIAGLMKSIGVVGG